MRKVFIRLTTSKVLIFERKGFIRLAKDFPKLFLGYFFNESEFVQNTFSFEELFHHDTKEIFLQQKVKRDF